MKIVNIIGGLGNQMFQYAFALTLSNRFPEEEVLIDTSHFHYLFLKKWKSANLHNGFEIEDVFPNAKLKKATFKQLIKTSWYVPNYLLSRIIRKCLPRRKKEYVQNKKDYFTFQPEPYAITSDCYYEGLWESVRYYLPYKEQLIDVFTHPVPDVEHARIIEEMESGNSVGVHVRRGDYLQTDSFKGICDLKYYEKAFEKIIESGLEHTFYIFSNDIEWCKENLVALAKGNKIVFVTNNTGKNSCWDMFLMTHCKSLVIANSSFSWWGAFLNPVAETIIAPDKWMNRDCAFDIWAPNWIKL